MFSLSTVSYRPFVPLGIALEAGLIICLNAICNPVIVLFPSPPFLALIMYVQVWDTARPFPEVMNFLFIPLSLFGAFSL